MPGFSAPLFQCRPFVSRRKIWCDLQKNQLDEKMIAQIKIRSRCVPATGSTPTRRLLLHAYKSSAPAGVRLIQPSSDMHETEAAVKTLGQAYISHVWCRELQIKMGKEQDLFQGLARCLTDTFSTEPVLLLSEDCNAAGILLSSQEEKQLVTALQALDFSVIAGTLQIMQAMPEARLPKLTSQLAQLQQGSARLAQAQGHSSYLKLVCLGVRPASQDKGLGRSLLAAAMDKAQQEGQLLMADAADVGVVQMLERRGFKALGSSGLLSQLAWAPL